MQYFQPSLLCTPCLRLWKISSLVNPKVFYVEYHLDVWWMGKFEHKAEKWSRIIEFSSISGKKHSLVIGLTLYCAPWLCGRLSTTAVHSPEENKKGCRAFCWSLYAKDTDCVNENCTRMDMCGFWWISIQAYLVVK